VVGVTLGERGSVFRVDGAVHRIAAPAVEAKDTNGAGDVFHGAYALALAEGMRVIDAIRFASVAAALKCRSGSGWEAAPDRAAVDEFLKGCMW
jgi:sulfofructose kinase